MTCRATSPPGPPVSLSDLVVAVNGVWILVETFMLKGVPQGGLWGGQDWPHTWLTSGLLFLPHRWELLLQARALELPRLSDQ